MPHWAKEPKDRKKLDKVDYTLGSKVKLAPPTLGEGGGFFDNSAALLSRLYERDRDRVLHRARVDGVCGIMCWHPEIEKLEELHKLCSMNESFCYFMAGVHPDNISRTNKTQQDSWHLKVDEFSRERSCRAIFSGLNVTRRDVQSHFAQESMLRCLYQHAKTLSVPLVLLVESREAESKPGIDFDQSVNTNLVRVTDLLREEGWGGGSKADDIAVVVFDALTTCRADSNIMEYIVQSGYHVSIVPCDLLAAKCAGGSEADLAACLALVPRERMLLSSNSPHSTPQNIPDEIIRASKNEPSNFKYIVQLLAPLFGMSEEDLTNLNLDNSKLIYKIDGSLVVPEKPRKAEGDLRKLPADEVDCEAEALSQLALGEKGGVMQEDLNQCYACVKCAAVLFSCDNLTQRHSAPAAAADQADAIGTVFRLPGSDDAAGGVQYCDAVYFLPLSLLGTVDGAYADTLSVDSKMNVACKACSAKIGKQYGAGCDDSGSSCPCGFAVDCSSGVLRLSSAKVQPYSSAVSKTKAKRDIKDDEGEISHGGRAPKGKPKDGSGAVEKHQPKPAGNKKGKSTRKNH